MATTKKATTKKASKKAKASTIKPKVVRLATLRSKSGAGARSLSCPGDCKNLSISEGGGFTRLVVIL